MNGVYTNGYGNEYEDGRQESLRGSRQARPRAYEQDSSRTVGQESLRWIRQEATRGEVQDSSRGDRQEPLRATGQESPRGDRQESLRSVGQEGFREQRNGRPREGSLRNHGGPRAGGYGGFSPTGNSSLRQSRTQQVTRPTDLERRRAHRRSTDRGSWTSSRSRSRPGEGRATKQIDDVLQHMHQDWSFMTQDRCVPVQVALQLLDDSSLGLARKYNEFQDAQQQLQTALRAIVNEHHAGFSSSIGTFHQIQASIQSSHDRVRLLKESLVDAKANLSTVKPELTNLASTSRNFANMLDVITTIEQIQQMPARVDAAISGKRFVAAVDHLQDALRLIRRSEMEEIGALDSMKLYLNNQEHSLTDILIEELHNHLYLKSPYCEEQWMSFVRAHQNSGSTQDFVHLADWEPRQMDTFLKALDVSVPLLEDTSRNPETDSFHYIYVIVEALTKLGRLEDAVDSLERRLPLEMFQVGEKTVGEIQQKYPAATSRTRKQAKNATHKPSPDSTAGSILGALTETLYSKYDAIAESHRVFNDVVDGVARREGLNAQHLTRGFHELWKLYQNEIRTLLHDYLSAKNDVASRSNQNLSGEGNIFRYQRDRNKKCSFTMDKVNGGGTDNNPERDEIMTTWQKFVPGLSSFSRGSASGSIMTNGTHETSVAGHKLLVDPSVFNISYLLPPSITLITRLKRLVPTRPDFPTDNLSSFLSDFLVNVFEPQLEETLGELCSQSFLQLDAFQPHAHWSHYAEKPICRGTVTFLEIITRFCRMLDDLTHDQQLSHLVLTQMNNYYDKCNGWYKALVYRAQVKSNGQYLKTSASLAANEDLKTLVSRQAGSSTKTSHTEVNQTVLEILQQSPLEESDLITDKKTQIALCLLHASMDWLATKLATLRYISPRATDVSPPDESNKPRLQRALTDALPDALRDEGATVYLPLSATTCTLFDGIVDGFRHLSASILQTLHFELRCHALYGLRACFRGNFSPADGASLAPDPAVLALAADLRDLHRAIAGHLSVAETRSVCAGLGDLVDAHVLASCAGHVQTLSKAGCADLRRDADVLYHNLVSVEADAELPRTMGWLALFEQGPDAVVAAGRAGLYSEAELTVLVQLQFRGLDRQGALKEKGDLDDRLMQLRRAMAATTAG